MAQPIETRGLCPLRQPFGGFWRRVLASVIDGLVLIAILGAAQAVIDVGLARSWPGPTVPWSFVWVSTGWLYFALMESSRLQATVGKLAGAALVDKIDAILNRHPAVAPQTCSHTRLIVIHDNMLV